jgi:hypothetical protein
MPMMTPRDGQDARNGNGLGQVQGGVHVGLPMSLFYMGLGIAALYVFGETAAKLGIGWKPKVQAVDDDKKNGKKA